MTVPFSHPSSKRHIPTWWEYDWSEYTGRPCWWCEDDKLASCMMTNWWVDMHSTSSPGFDMQCNALLRNTVNAIMYSTHTLGQHWWPMAISSSYFFSLTRCIMLMNHLYALGKAKTPWRALHKYKCTWIYPAADFLLNFELVWHILRHKSPVAC